MTDMHSFYIEAPVDGSAALPPGEAKHALKVLRLRPGDGVCAMDGVGGRWRGEIGAIDGSRVRVKLLEPLPDNEAPVRVTVYEGLPKADKLDFIAQKLTELGAAALMPVRMERCVVGWTRRTAKSAGSGWTRSPGRPPSSAAGAGHCTSPRRWTGPGPFGRWPATTCC